MQRLNLDLAGLKLRSGLTSLRDFTPVRGLNLETLYLKYQLFKGLKVEGFGGWRGNL